MNLFLHGIGGDESPIRVADSLAAKDSSNYDMVLTNPPFGKKSSITIINEEGEESREALMSFAMTSGRPPATNSSISCSI
jgi:type I restriction enzyme M protein